MSTKFLGSTATGNLTDGTVAIVGSTIGAANLIPSKALKTNSVGTLISTDLAISDTTGLQDALDAGINTWGRGGTLIVPITTGDTVGFDTFQSEGGVNNIVITNTTDHQDNLLTDQISESTADTGVTIEGVILKDNTIEVSSATFPVLKFIRSGSLTGGDLESMTGIGSSLQGVGLSSGAIGEGFGGGCVFAVEGSNQAEVDVGRLYFRLTSAGTTSGEFQIWGGALGNTLIRRIATTDHRSYVAGTEVMNLASTGLNIDTIKEFTADNGVSIEGNLLKDSTISTNAMDVSLPGDDQVVIDGSSNPRTITTGITRINHIAGVNGTRALHLEMDPSTFDDTRAVAINYDLNGSSTASTINGWFMDCDITGTTNKHISYFHAEKTGSVGAGMDIHCLHIEPEIDVIEHHSGVFLSIEKAFTENGGFTDVTANFNTTVTDTTLFVSNGDKVYLGKATIFNEIDFTLATVASGAGIDPLIEYSDGVSSFATLSASDSTSGFRNSGIISWDPPVGWSSEAVNGETLFWIRITRQRVALTTTPVEDIVKYQASVIYTWNATGDLSINDLEVAGTQTVDTINEFTTDNGVDIETVHLENGNISNITTTTTTNIVCAEVQTNTTHISSDGSDHGFLNQDVQSTASPAFVGITTDSINEKTVDNGVNIEGMHAENGTLSLGSTTQAGSCKLDIEGTNADRANGCIVNYFTSNDATRPRMQHTAFSLDDCSITFDGYFSSIGTLTSSDAGSSFMIRKNSDVLTLSSDTANVGDPLTMNTGLSMDNVGAISLPVSLDIGSSTVVDGVIDDDSMATASATTLATSESITAYVDANVSGQEWGGFASSVLNVTGDNTVYTLIWDNEEFDEAGIFTSAGVTVTVSGTYQVNVDVDLSGILSANHSLLTLICTAGGIAYTNIQAIAINGQHHVQLSFVCKLVATNTIITTIGVNGDSKVADISANTRFSGHLVKAT